MPNLIARLRAELIARVENLQYAAGSPVTSRGYAVDETTLPRAFVWIEEDTVRERTKGDTDDRSASREYHRVFFSVGVITKNAADISTLDAMVGEVRSRMLPRFENQYDIELSGVEYEDEVRTYSRPFVSASLNFTMDYSSDEGDDG
jgi:hypothetical protein